MPGAGGSPRQSGRLTDRLPPALRLGETPRGRRSMTPLRQKPRQRLMREHARTSDPAFLHM